MLDQVKSLISTHEKLLLLLQSKIVDIHNALGEIKIIIIIIRIIVNKIRTKFRTSEKTCISRYTYERSTSNYPPFLLHALIDLHFQSKTVTGIVRFSNFVAISILGEITNVQFPCRVISTKRGQKIGDITRRTKICGKSKRLESWPRSWTIAERNIVPLLDLLYSLSLHPSLSLSLSKRSTRGGSRVPETGEIKPMPDSIRASDFSPREKERIPLENYGGEGSVPSLGHNFEERESGNDCARWKMVGESIDYVET